MEKIKREIRPESDEKLRKLIGEGITVLERREFDKVYEKHPELREKLLAIKSEFSGPHDPAKLHEELQKLSREIADLTDEVDEID